MSKQTLSVKRLIALVIAATVASGCYERNTPTSPSEGVEEAGHGPFSIVGALTCTADVAEPSLSCDRRKLTPGMLGPRFLIVGGQGVFVELVSSNPSYDPVAEIFQADVQVANRLGDDTGIGQQLGTPDEIEITGVRVFFHTGPSVTNGSGTVTVRNEDGTGEYTGVDQPYHEYDVVLPPWFISSAKTWEWDVPNTVNSFVFEVYVEADVPHANGFVQTDPVWAYMSVGSSTTLSASIRDHLNRPVSGTITWTSLDPSIATVNSSTGQVSAQSGGIVDIIASSSGSEDDGFTRVTVPRSGYQIDLRYLTSLTSTQKQAFEDARARWESHLTGDVPDALANSNGHPVCEGAPVNEVLDDLVINVNVEAIDEEYGVLAHSSACLYRSSGIPALGHIELDEADLAFMEDNDLLYTVILHEMGHVLGFDDDIWSYLGLLLGAGTADPRFSGTYALAAYQGIGGSGTTGAPLDGTGSSDSHWREATCSTCETSDYFGNELMTPYINMGANPLSVVTINHFKDIGYPGVDDTGADDFTLNPTSLALQAEGGMRIELINDVWRGPKYVINKDGTLTLVLPDRR